VVLPGGIFLSPDHHYFIR